MKNLKTFESFAAGEYSDLDIKLYVDYLLSSDNFIGVFDLIGLEAPMEVSGHEYEEVMSDARDLAFIHFRRNQTDIDTRKMEEAKEEDKNY